MYSAGKGLNNPPVPAHLVSSKMHEVNTRAGALALESGTEMCRGHDPVFQASP